MVVAKDRAGAGRRRGDRRHAEPRSTRRSTASCRSRPAEERVDNPSAARALANQFGYRVRDALRVPLSELGVKTEEFSGRLFRTAFDIRLPGDFYGADYDKLTLSLTAGYAQGLAPTAQILVRVNDHEAGSMPMKNPRGDVFRDRPVSVSLSALRPGVNHVVVEAQTPDVDDAACEVKHIMDMHKRFVLFDRSELIVPNFAHIGRLPNLAATLSSAFPYQTASDGVIFAPSRDRLTLSALGSYLARTAVVSGRPVGARITFDPQAAKKGSALFVGAFDDFPPALIEEMGVDYQSLRKTWARQNGGETTYGEGSLAEPGATAPGLSLSSNQVFDQWAEGSHAAPENFSPRLTLGAVYDRYINIHSADFAALRRPDRPIEAPERSTILLAQARAETGFDTWTLVAGASRALLARDMASVVAPSNWNEIEGRAAAFTPRSGAKPIDRAANAYFVPTAALTPRNLRLIAAGFLSANLDVLRAGGPGRRGAVGAGDARGGAGARKPPMIRAARCARRRWPRRSGSPRRRAPTRRPTTGRATRRASSPPKAGSFDDSAGDVSHSEGQGYAMVLAAFNDDPQTFAGPLALDAGQSGDPRRSPRRLALAAERQSACARPQQRHRRRSADRLGPRRGRKALAAGRV